MSYKTRDNLFLFSWYVNKKQFTFATLDFPQLETVSLSEASYMHIKEYLTLSVNVTLDHFVIIVFS